MYQITKSVTLYHQIITNYHISENSCRITMLLPGIQDVCRMFCPDVSGVINVADD